jgi:hypothetical protein
VRNGCLKNALASIGCLTVLVLLGVAVWQYRGQAARVYRSVVYGENEAGGPTTGVPSLTALVSAERKERAIARRGGPRSVHLTADEMASLVEDRLDPAARRALDSLRITLDQGRFTLEGQILLDVFTRELLGPIAQALESRQPLRVAGPVTLREPGIVAWACDEFVVASFPFPQSALPTLINQLTGGRDGAFLIPVPETVGEIHVGRDGVTFYRRGD